jgi:predicted oxidoreductase
LTAHEGSLESKTVGGGRDGDDADVIVVGGGLAGLAATEIADGGKRVIVVDQEGEQSLGGQAFVVRRAELVDLPNSAGSASGIPTISHCKTGWDSGLTATTTIGREVKEAYVAFAAGEKRDYCVRWGTVSSGGRLAERGGYDAMGHGTGAALSCHMGHRSGDRLPFERRAREAEKSGRLTTSFATASTHLCDGRRGRGRQWRCSSRTRSSAARASRKVIGDFMRAPVAVLPLAASAQPRAGLGRTGRAGLASRRNS